eukprot:6719669-Alexandrium_andersonii.AAC.1
MEARCMFWLWWDWALWPHVVLSRRAVRRSLSRRYLTERAFRLKGRALNFKWMRGPAPGKMVHRCPGAWNTGFPSHTLDVTRFQVGTAKG